MNHQNRRRFAEMCCRNMSAVCWYGTRQLDTIRPLVLAGFDDSRRPFCKAERALFSRKRGVTTEDIVRLFLFRYLFIYFSSVHCSMQILQFNDACQCDEGKTCFGFLSIIFQHETLRKLVLDQFVCGKPSLLGQNMVLYN
jgi:hypothetical protein